MRKGKHRLAAVSAALAVALVGVACGGDGAGGLTGTIAISGSSTVEPITSLVAELFAENNPDVNVSVNGPGTGDGFALFCAGEIDISDASRPISDEEVATCQSGGINYVELEVAFDGITVMTNPANADVTCLDFKDLYALVGPESEGFANWSDADALATEVEAGHTPYPTVPLTIVGPGEESGTYDAFVDLIGIEDLALERGVPEDQAAATRPDYQSSPNDNVIIQGMQGSDTPLGWVGFAFAEEAGDQIKEIEVDGGSGCVAPSIESIADGSYPISRSLYIYVNTDKAGSNEALRAFVDLYLTADGLTTSVTDAGYVELPTDRQEATQTAWSGTSVG